MESETKTPCMSSKNECCICFEDQTDKLTSKLPCNHEMCVSCTMTLAPPVCPLCRKDFSSALEEFKNIIHRLNIQKDSPGISFTQTEFPSLPSSLRVATWHQNDHVPRGYN